MRLQPFDTERPLINPPRPEKRQKPPAPNIDWDARDRARTKEEWRDVRRRIRPYLLALAVAATVTALLASAIYYGLVRTRAQERQVSVIAEQYPEVLNNREVRR